MMSDSVFPSPYNPRALLRHFGIQPRKSLGQNFLVSEAAAWRIVTAARLEPSDVVLEVGPGLGALTVCLARSVERVVAVELDAQLIPVLEYTLASYSNVKLVHSDILAQEPASLVEARRYKVVANIPYYITSALIRHLLASDTRPVLMVLTVQEEVARRIVAEPGEMSLLALSVQLYGKPEIVTRLKPGSFFPSPQVASAVVRVDLDPAGRPALGLGDETRLFRIARAGFGQRRKQLRNALAAGLGWSRERVEAALAQAGVAPQRRAETLSVDEWVALARAFEARGT